MTTLLEIGADLAALQAILDECDGEIDEQVAATLDTWFAELKAGESSKIDSYCALIREHKLRADARAEEAARLQRLSKVDANVADRLESRLLAYCREHGIDRMKTARFNLSVCNNGGKLPMVIDADPRELPTQYQRVRVEPDRDALYRDLANGVQIGGVRLLPRGVHLRVS